MRQVRFFVGRVLIASVAGLMLLAVPARADVITLHFQGAVDLTSEGGTTYTYSGHFTWNTAAAPFETEPDVSSYALVDYSLIFDGDDFSFAPSPDGNGNGLAVADDSNFGDPLGVRGRLRVLGLGGQTIRFERRSVSERLVQRADRYVQLAGPSGEHGLPVRCHVDLHELLLRAG